jgi:hypothetical protein
MNSIPEDEAARGIVVVKALCYKPEGHGFEIDELNEFFLIYIILRPHCGLWFTQPPTEMNTRSRKMKFLGNKARPVRKADNFIIICKPIV